MNRKDQDPRPDPIVRDTDPRPDPYQNITDPEHWKKGRILLPGHSAIVQPNFTIEFDPELCLERVNLQQDRITINVPLFKKLRDIIFFCG
jgi:hypothetical protein